jgi:hypothetical protein
MQKLEAMRLQLSFLVHDLRTFKDNPDAVKLNNSTSLHHVGPPYLTDLEAVEALTTPIHAFHALSKNHSYKKDDSETLGMYLDARMQEVIQGRRSRGAEGADFILCTSHDLEPIMKTALGLEGEFGKTKIFKSAYKQWTKS